MIVLGIDAGTKLAQTIVDTAPDRPRLIRTDTIVVGRLEPREKPVTVTPKDGREPYELTHKVVVTDEDRRRVSETVRALVLQYGVQRMVIEAVNQAYMATDATPAKAASVATHLARAEGFARALQQLGWDLGLEVVTVTAANWRHVVVGSKRGQAVKGAGKELLAPVIAEEIYGWPDRSDPHQRDSAGVILWDLVMRRRAEEKAARPPAAPRAYAFRGRDLSKEERARRRLEKRKAERAERALAEGRPVGRIGGVPGRARKCAKCGGPKVGHLQGLPCPPLPTAPVEACYPSA